jgi:hypothetical protein
VREEEEEEEAAASERITVHELIVSFLSKATLGGSIKYDY